jgi:hypothetical protein
VNQSGDAGIQQILLLPAVEKACVVANATLSFYTLPELTPAPPLKPLNCAWVGGGDLDADDNGDSIMMCLRKVIRLVRVAQEQPLKLRDIEFGACLATVRRGDFACVADSRSYALLDVVHQQKIPLFPISSIDFGPANDISENNTPRNASPDPLRNTLQDERGHRKTSSLSVFRKDDDHPRLPGTQRYGFDSPQSLRSSRRVSTTDISLPHSSPAPRKEFNKPLPTPPQPDSRSASPFPPRPPPQLKPLIASPSSQLFLLVTGTALDEPSVGMFVNLDGDVDRGTIEFTTYPDAIVVDGKGYDTNSSMAGDDFAEEGYVLAVVKRLQSNVTKSDIEVQRWDASPGEDIGKEWLNLPAAWSQPASLTHSIGLRDIGVKQKINVPEIATKLTMKPIQFFAAPNGQTKEAPNPARLQEEADFVQRLCQVDAHITLWHDNHIFWILRNPALLKLDSRLRLSQSTSLAAESPILPQRELIEVIFNETRGARSTTELDFFSFRYIRQKAALLLFLDLVLRTIDGILVSERDKVFTEQALAESELDPRLIVALLPDINLEISHAKDGIWVQAGVEDIFDTFTSQVNISEALKLDPKGPYGENLLQLVKRFLLFWRRKKGNPSVIDGTHIFPSVDAAILHILLILDDLKPPGSAAIGSTRSELYAVVDNGVDCYERAVELLESYNRLYVLSRLFGKRKSSTMVLSTWRRILEEKDDPKSEFTDGDNEVRKYLGKLKDKSLVLEYGTWLANRNPKVGVQVFADETNKVVIPPTEALAVLREKSPNAVKDYLEHLVFGKKVKSHILTVYSTNHFIATTTYQRTSRLLLRHCVG